MEKVKYCVIVNDKIIMRTNSYKLAKYTLNKNLAEQNFSSKIINLEEYIKRQQ